MLKNKHLIAAMIIAPVLAVLAYFLVDAWLTPPAAAPQAGISYPLVAGSKCRYESGRCVLKNGNFELMLVASWPAEKQLSLELESAHPLEYVKLVLAPSQQASPAPATMRAISGDGTRWVLELPWSGGENGELRIVAAAGGNYYYGSSPLDFLRYQTAFNEDFRQLQ